jgi:hypothetical protein
MGATFSFETLDTVKDGTSRMSIQSTLLDVCMRLAQVGAFNADQKGMYTIAVPARLSDCDSERTVPTNLLGAVMSVTNDPVADGLFVPNDAFTSAKNTYQQGMSVYAKHREAQLPGVLEGLTSDDPLWYLKSIGQERIIEELSLSKLRVRLWTMTERGLHDLAGYVFPGTYKPVRSILGVSWPSSKPHDYLGLDPLCGFISRESVQKSAVKVDGRGYMRTVEYRGFVSQATQSHSGQWYMAYSPFGIKFFTDFDSLQVEMAAYDLPGEQDFRTRTKYIHDIGVQSA